MLVEAIEDRARGCPLVLAEAWGASCHVERASRRRRTAWNGDSSVLSEDALESDEEEAAHDVMPLTEALQSWLFERRQPAN